MRRFKKLSDNAIIPTRKTRNSAAYDLCVPDGKEIIIHPRETVKFESGIAAQINDDEFLAIYVRSSIGIKKSLMLPNGTGIIDSDYFGNKDNGGNIIIALHNFGEQTVILEPKQRVAQCIFQKYLTVDDEKEITNERTGGIGSTD